MRICVSSRIERIGAPPALSTRSAKRSVGTAVCSTRSASTTAKASSGIESAAMALGPVAAMDARGDRYAGDRFGMRGSIGFSALALIPVERSAVERPSGRCPIWSRSCPSSCPA